MTDKPNEFPIVGIGASAGGLEAFQIFFSQMPEDSGMAFVIVQHLDPNHESMMTELLSKSTKMEVYAVEDNMEVIPNKVYVIQPNSTLTIINGHLHVEKPQEPRGHRMPIDHFFHSLSQDQGENAICIILSGTGSDGTLGLKAVKEHGGIAIAQNPERAKYDSMPFNAVKTGLVDLVLNIEEMPQKLIDYLNNQKILKEKLDDENESEHLVEFILNTLKIRTGHEFSGYKKSTIARRLRRRMQLLHMDSLEQYVEIINTSPKEVNLLFKDLLIGVTHFFRNSDAFKSLREKAISKIIRHKLADENSTGIRIWIPGCATGEEAYTIAMLVKEEADNLNFKKPVQIFATDIDDQALQVARRGVYPEGIREQIPENFLKKYFKENSDVYRVRDEIREVCIFSPHNLIKDPPFSKIDLVACRNLLIYFEISLQKKILPIFHYSISPNGYLFLGPSENITARKELFKVIDKSSRIYQAKDAVPPMLVDFPISQNPASKKSYGGVSNRVIDPDSDKSMAKIFEEKVFNNYIPFSAVINENSDILYWAGPVVKYIEPPPGRPHNNLIELANKSLRLSLRSSIHRSVSQNKEVIQKNVVVKTNEGLQKLMIIVTPFKEMGEKNNLFLVVLKELGLPLSGEDAVNGERLEQQGEEVNRQLEEELRHTKEYLQTTIEELETSNEELKSSNEELLSMNEELQSSNEELQTSKEELQSINEELQTVNAELKKKVEELDQANSDIHNLYESTQIAIIFLDNSLAIKGFTPSAKDLFRIIESDIGRNLGDIVAKFKVENLLEEAESVLRNLERKRVEIYLEETDSHYVMQLVPYRTVSNKIDGVTISFIDVTELKIAHEETNLRERMLSIVTDSVPVLISYIDKNEKYLFHNAQYSEWFGLKDEQINGKSIKKVLGNDAYNILKPNIIKALKGETVEFVTSLNYKHDGERSIRAHYEPHFDEFGNVAGFIALVEDITFRIEREKKLARLAAIVSNSHEVIVGMDRERKITDWNVGAENLYGYKENEVLGKSIDIVVPPELQDETEELHKKVINGKNIPPFETVRIKKDKSQVYLFLSNSAIKNDEGKIFGISAVAHDITPRIKSRKRIEELNQTLESRVEERTEQLRNMTNQLLKLEHQERRNFSHLLHDQIQQLIVAAKLNVLRSTKKIEDAELKDQLGEAVNHLDEAISESRSITLELSPPLMMERGLNHVLEFLRKWTKQKYELDVKINFIGKDQPVNEETGFFLYSTLKELLFNIVKHAGTKQAFINAEFREEDGLHLDVIDKGVGFDTQIIKENTDKFGLLSIIERMNSIGGKIEFISKDNDGTLVKIQLPQNLVEYNSPSTKISSEKTDKPDESQDKNLENESTILIVDDERAMRYAIALMLKDETNYNLIEANSGAEAVKKAKKYKPKVILMDVRMPGMDGIEATKLIKDDMPGIFIIGLSMHDRETIEKDLLDAGADYYLSKNDDPSVILETINNYLKNKDENK